MKRLPDVLKMTVESSVVDGFKLKNLSGVVLQCDHSGNLWICTCICSVCN